MKELITSMSMVPIPVQEHMNDFEKHILASLLEHGFHLRCYMSLEGYKILPKQFKFDLPFHPEIFKREIRDHKPSETFGKTLKSFIGAVVSHETKLGFIYIKDEQRQANYAVSPMERIEESYSAMNIKNFHLGKVTKSQAMEIFTSLQKRENEILGQATSTTKSY